MILSGTGLNKNKNKHVEPAIVLAKQETSAFQIQGIYI